MGHDGQQNEDLCDEALAAANRAITLGERIRLFEQACGYARLASLDRKRSNVYRIGSHRQ
jgi:hypothetical protein